MPRVLSSFLGALLMAVAGCGGTTTGDVGASDGPGSGGAPEAAGGGEQSGGGQSTGGEGSAGGGAGAGGVAGAGGMISSGGSPYAPCDCAPATVASDQTAPIYVALDEEHVYWSLGRDRSQRIMKAPLVGGEAAVLVDVGTLNEMRGFAIDSSFVYWGIFGDVKRAPLAGGEPVTFVPAADPTAWVSGLVTDSTSVYWSVRDGERDGAILKAPSAGGDAVPVTTVRGGVPYDLHVNATHVYWALRFGVSVPSVMRAPIEGGPPELLAPVGDSVEGIALDEQFVYRTGGRSLWRAPIEGGPWTELATHPTLATSVASKGRHAYWGVTSTLVTNLSGDAMDGALLRTTPDGSTTLVAYGMNPRAIATHGEWICWTAAAWLAYGDKGSVMCLGPEG